MSVSMNKVIEELSRSEPGATRPARTSSTSLKNSTGSTAPVISEKPLSAHEQTAALSQRYEEAGIKVSVQLQL